MIGGLDEDHVLRASINRKTLIEYFTNYLYPDIMNIMKEKDIFKHYGLYLK